MNCKVRATSSAQEVYDCVRETWCKYFPRDLMPDLANFEMHSSESGSPLDISEVVSAARYLRHLVIMGIDKGKNRKLFMCPSLFQQRYNQTFPATTDCIHYRKLNMKETEFVAYLKRAYKGHKWWLLASWNAQGSMPVPYPLYKLKDLVRPCGEVFAEKGKCCRCRPILPNSKHWLRRVYRRVGSVLRLLVASIPPEYITMMRACDLVKILDEWSEKAPIGTKWAKWTGDISNCYDELRF